MTLVSLVIVSHSQDVAKGTTEMVRQMVGEELAIAYAGGAPDGGLGTDPMAIKAALESVLSDAGTAILVDLGGAEMNAEMAIEMFDEETQKRMRICNAPIVEGAIVAGVEASSGSPLAEVVTCAEEMSG